MAFASFDRQPSGAPVSEINMVPLIDVMLVLLVIFIVTAPLLTHSVKLELPQASSQVNPPVPVKIEFAIDADGQRYWNGERVSREEAAARFLPKVASRSSPRSTCAPTRPWRIATWRRPLADASKAGLDQGRFREPARGEMSPVGVPAAPVCLADYAALARDRLDDNARAYFEGGAADELTLAANVQAWRDMPLSARVLRPMAGGHTRVELFGRMLAHPILLAPVAYQRLAHPDGERATAQAAAALQAGMVLSTQSSVPVEDVARIVCTDPGRRPALVPALPAARPRFHA